MDLINVGVSQIKLASSPQILRTILGSCVGICIYDRNKKIGGLAHVLLPKNSGKGAPEKFADTAIPMLVDMLLKQGCKREFMSAKIAGGASMFKFSKATALCQIGENNINAVKHALEEKKIPLYAEHVGDCNGRVIDFFMEDGRLKVKASNKEEIFYKV